MSEAGDAILGLFVDTIAAQVAAKIRAEIAKQFDATTRVAPTLMSVKDAAAYLGRSEAAVQHLIFGKEFPVVRAGRRVHLDRRDLDAWIERNKC